MGFTTVKAKISSVDDPSKSILIDLLVDTGATFTVVPKEKLKDTGLKPKVRRKMKTADGRVVERDGATALVEVMGKVDEVPIVFGEKDDAAILGVTTLEILGFDVDPTTRQLKPTEYLFL